MGDVTAARHDVTAPVMQRAARWRRRVYVSCLYRWCQSARARAYSKRVFRTNCALRIKKCAPRISSGIYFLSTSYA